MITENENNEEIFYDAEEKQTRLKIIKKKQAAKIIIQRPEIKKFTSADNQYLEYKAKLLGKVEPDRTDKYCDFYLCNDIQQIKYFVKNINKYPFNTDLSIEHISNITKKINKTKELYFVNPIALVEYANISMDSYKNLIELIDGHHRLQCLENVLNNFEYDEINFTFWIQVYKCYSEKESAELFRKYNSCKPFAINLGLIDLITLMIDKLNTQFNFHKFEFIKNTKERANRPSFSKKEFSEKIKSRLEEQLKTTNKDDYNDIDLDNIISKFINYNKSLQSETLEWFNLKCKKDSSKITENIYKKAKANKCMLGLLPLEDLIIQCVSL